MSSDINAILIVLKNVSQTHYFLLKNTFFDFLVSKFWYFLVVIFQEYLCRHPVQVWISAPIADFMWSGSLGQISIKWASSGWLCSRNAKLYAKQFFGLSVSCSFTIG